MYGTQFQLFSVSRETEIYFSYFSDEFSDSMISSVPEGKCL